MLCLTALMTQIVNQRINSADSRATIDLIQRSWVRFPPSAKNFSLLASCSFPFPNEG